MASSGRRRSASSRASKQSQPPRRLGDRQPVAVRPTRAERQQQGQAELARARAAAARRRRRRLVWSTAGGTLVALGLALGLVIGIALGTAGQAPAREVMPPVVAGGAPDVQPAALVVANSSGIPGVVAYDTTGWPLQSRNGPAAEALRHRHVAGPVRYSVSPPVGGDHNAIWANCGVYDRPLASERAVHDLEHGGVWITYRPGLPSRELAQLRAFEQRQSLVGTSGSRYVDLSPYPGLSSPIVISSWGFQLRADAPGDPRLQRFVDTFRASASHSPEPGGECTGGVGTPLLR